MLYKSWYEDFLSIKINLRIQEIIASQKTTPLFKQKKKKMIFKRAMVWEALEFLSSLN